MTITARDAKDPFPAKGGASAAAAELVYPQGITGEGRGRVGVKERSRQRGFVGLIPSLLRLPVVPSFVHWVPAAKRERGERGGFVVMAHSEFMIKKFPLSPTSYLLPISSFPCLRCGKRLVGWIGWSGWCPIPFPLFWQDLFFSPVVLVFVFKPRRGCESRCFYIS